MSVYVVTGKLGNGKTLLAVAQIKKALAAGRRVATNLNLEVEHLLPANNRTAQVIRIPDKPTARDLELLGPGTEVRADESKYGLIVLDELGTWFNSRAWGDKERQPTIDWLLHSRKHRWDLILIVQNEMMMDKQARESLVQYLVTCTRLDRIKVPFLGFIGKLLTFGLWDGRIGRLHLGIVILGDKRQNAIITDRWVYRGNDLFAAYDTEQVFRSNYEHGLFSYLPPWQKITRYRPEPRTWVHEARDFWEGVKFMFGGPLPSGYRISKFGAFVKGNAARPAPRPVDPRRGPQLRPVVAAVQAAFMQSGVALRRVGPGALGV